MVIVRELRPGDGLAVGRDEPLVCLPWFGTAQAREATLHSVAAHTPVEVPVILVGRALDRAALAGQWGTVLPADRELLALAVPTDDHAGALNATAERAPAADLVVLAPGTRVGPEWLAQLRAAAHCDSTVVSATALADHAGPLSVAPVPPRVDSTHQRWPGAGGGEASGQASVAAPVQADGAGAGGGEESGEGGVAAPAEADGADGGDKAASVVARSSLRAYPRIACAAGHCVYLRRAALERLGPFAWGLAGLDAVMADFSVRALQRGMLHVAADDVYVTRGSAVAPANPADPSEEDEELTVRLPGQGALRDVDRRDERSVLRRCLATARIALRGLSVTIDARALGPSIGGTQVYTVELIMALAGSGRARVRAVVPPDLSPAAARAFAGEPSLELISYEQAVAGVARTEIVHRPQQIFTIDDLNLLWLLGERVVIGQQDLIAYRNPAYHESLEAWQQYRRVSRMALAAADRVVFFSRHAERDAVLEDLIAPERTAVAGIGADVMWERQVEPARPAGLTGDRDFLVCLGADYGHKNRPFALALVQQLRRRDGWEGRLVLAGAHVPFGSSREEERVLLDADADLAEEVVDLGPVDEAGKAWLYAHARAVVYPTSYEGFGLVPFEAARAGAPCLFAPQASLAELAGPGAATLLPWDPQVSADAAAPLLHAGAERDAHVMLLRAAADGARWSEVVERLLATYDLAARAPQRAASPRVWQELERERYIAALGQEVERLRDAYEEIRSVLGIGLPLIARDGLLSRDEQQGLMRIATRRPLHRLLLGPIGLLGRLPAGPARSRPDGRGAAAAEDESGSPGGQAR